MPPPAHYGVRAPLTSCGLLQRRRAPPGCYLRGCGSIRLGGASRCLAGLWGGRLLFSIRSVYSRYRAGATPPITPARGSMARATPCALLTPPRLRCSYSYYEGRRGMGARLGTTQPPQPCSRWSCCCGLCSSPRHCAHAPPPKSGGRWGIDPQRAYLSATAGTIPRQKSYY